MDIGLTIQALPAEAPLAMPVQSLRRGPAERRRIDKRPSVLWLRRLLVIGSAIVLTGVGAEEMYRVLAVNGLTAPGIFMLLLFVALFAWIALSFTSAIAGFFSIVTKGGARLLTPGPPTTRTALLMPTYNESPDRIVAALAAMDEDLRQAGATHLFDVYILSDTTRPEVWIQEERAWLGLCARTGGHGRIFYRHRPKNTARKAGNIAEWVTRFGGAYPQFLILDADSVMRADTLLSLVRAMEAHPDTGLIQTLPMITGGTTLFARMQQFAGRIYGPVIAHGIAWWHGTEGNYWGHNALIRTIAFAQQAGLPELHGRKPFGGHIMSHDFVEAALMRRGGWAIHMMPALEGSYEESPPSLVDLSVRDRRWCQGNLQHAAVLPSKGLHWVSRLHLMTGIVIALQARFIPPDYFGNGTGKSLFPVWPVIDPVRAMWVFIGTMAMLMVPKVLGIIAALFQKRLRKGSGGVFGLLVSLVLESLIAGLLAPVVMLTQSIDVAAILLGRDSGWNAQRRDDGGIPFGEIVRGYRRHTILGIALGVGAWAVSTSLALWMTPVILGLLLAVPLAAWTGRRDAGQALRRIGLLRIPEETYPPAVLQRTQALQAAIPHDETDIPTLLRDPELQAAHRAMLPPPRRPGIDPLNVSLLTGTARLAEARDLASAWPTLDAAERTAVLSDAAALDRLLALAERG
jgi:membrane glycosyltransferase